MVFIAKAIFGLILINIIGLTDAYWRMNCGIIQSGRIDPIVSPGKISQHVHKLVGASSKYLTDSPHYFFCSAYNLEEVLTIGQQISASILLMPTYKLLLALLVRYSKTNRHIGLRSSTTSTRTARSKKCLILAPLFIIWVEATTEQISNPFPSDFACFLVTQMLDRMTSLRSLT